MSEDSDYKPKGRPLTGRKVMLMMVAFFGVMLGVNAFMARMAVKTHPGLDRANPYDQGIAYNKEIEAAKAQNDLGWTVDLNRGREGAATSVSIRVRDKDGRPVNGLNASLHFTYPATSRLDTTVAAQADGDGVYTGVAQLQGGHWDLDVQLDREGQRQFRSHNTLVVE